MPITALTPAQQHHQLETFVDFFVDELMAEVRYLEALSRGDISERAKASMATLFNVACALVSLVPIPGLVIAFAASKPLLLGAVELAKQAKSAVDGIGLAGRAHIADQFMEKGWGVFRQRVAPLASVVRERITTRSEAESFVQQAEAVAQFVQQEWGIYQGIAPEIELLGGGGATVSSGSEDGKPVDPDSLKVLVRWLGYQVARRYEQALTERLSLNPEKAMKGLAQWGARRCLAYLNENRDASMGDPMARTELLLAGIAIGHTMKMYERPLGWLHKHKSLKGRDECAEEKFTAEGLFERSICVDDSNPEALNYKVSGEPKWLSPKEMGPKYGYVVGHSKLPDYEGVTPDLKEWRERRLFQPISKEKIIAYLNSPEVVAAKAVGRVATIGLLQFLHEFSPTTFSRGAQAIFQGDLTDQDLSCGNFEGVDFSGSVIAGNLSYCNFAHARLYATTWKEIYARAEVSFAYAQLGFSHLSHARFEGEVDFTQSDLTCANLRSAVVGLVKQTGACWYKANLIDFRCDAIRLAYEVQMKEIVTKQEVQHKKLEVIDAKIAALETQLQPLRDRDLALDEKLQSLIEAQENRLKFEVDIDFKLSQLEGTTTEHGAQISVLREQLQSFRQVCEAAASALQERVGEVVAAQQLQGLRQEVQGRKLQEIEGESARLQAALEDGFKQFAVMLEAQRRYIDEKLHAAQARTDAQYGELVVELNKLKALPPSALPSIRRDLIKVYHEGYGSMDRAFSVGEGRSITEMYVGLSMLSEKDYQEESKREEDKGFLEQKYQGGIRIPLETLFERAQQAGKKNRLFVQGGPGMGKSTMCQYIAHQWASGVLFKEFTVLLWVPLREWEAKNEERLCGFYQFIKEKYSLSATEDEIEHALKMDKSQVLVLIDGFDEIHSDALRRRVIDFLRAEPNWLLTSRPNYQQGIRYELGFELIGFDALNRQSFIEKYFAEADSPGESKASEETETQDKSKKLITSLHQNKRLAEMARVPILLELLCFCCDAKGATIDDLLKEGRITTLYQVFIEKLARRYLTKFKGKSHSMDATLVARYTEFEHLFLEEAALQGAIEGRIYLNSDILRKTLATVRVKNSDFKFNDILEHGLLKRLGANKEGDETQNPHYFMHRSLQEYFAALAWLRTYGFCQHEASSPALRASALALFKLQKFNPAYRLIWQFVAGSLKTSEQVAEFFHLLLSEPRDLKEETSSQLLLACYDEVDYALFARLPLLQRKIDHYISQLIENGQPVHSLKAQRQLQQELVTEWKKEKRVNELKLLAILKSLKDPEVSVEGLLQEGIYHSTIEIALISAKHYFAGELSEDKKQQMIVLLGHDHAALRDYAAELIKEKLSPLTRAHEVLLASVFKGIKPESVQEFLITCLKFEYESSSNILNSKAKRHVFKVMVEGLGEYETELVGRCVDDFELLHSRALAAEQLLKFSPNTSGVISIWIQILLGCTSELQVRAAEALGKLRHSSPKIVAALLRILERGDRDVIEAAVVALGNLGQVTPEVVAALIRALRHRNEDIRKAATIAMGHLGQEVPEMFAILSDAMGDSDEYVRACALKNFGTLCPRTTKLEAVLYHALEDKEYNVRTAAIEVLMNLGQENPRVVDALIPVLDDAHDYVRVAAAKALGNLGQGNPRVVDVLNSALQDPKYHVRVASAEALGNIGQGNPRVVDALKAALRDPDASVQYAAAKALEALGQATPEIVVGLSLALKCYYFYVAEAFGNFAQIPSRLDVALICALESTESDVQASAAYVLGALGQATPEIIAALYNALKRAEYHSIYPVAITLATLGQTTPSVVRALFDALKSDRAGIIGLTEAFGFLGRATPEVVFSLLKALLENKKNGKYREDEKIINALVAALENVSQGTPEVVTSLSLALEHTRFNVKILPAICKALRSCGQTSASVAVILIEALGNRENNEIRKSAAHAILILGEVNPGIAAQVVAPLIAALKDEESSVRMDATSAIGAFCQESPEVMTALYDALRDKDAHVRSEAAKALGKFCQGNPGVLTALCDALRDKDEDVRSEAAKTLRKFCQGNSEVVSALVRAYHVRGSNARRDIGETLLCFGQATPEIVAALTQAIGEEEYLSHYPPSWTLGRFGIKNSAIISLLLQKRAFLDIVNYFYNVPVRFKAEFRYQSTSIVLPSGFLRELDFFLENPKQAKENKDLLLLLKAKICYGGLPEEMAGSVDPSLLMRFARELKITIYMDQYARETFDFVKNDVSRFAIEARAAGIEGSVLDLETSRRMLSDPKVSVPEKVGLVKQLGVGEPLIPIMTVLLDLLNQGYSGSRFFSSTSEVPAELRSSIVDTLGQLYLKEDFTSSGADQIMFIHGAVLWRFASCIVVDVKVGRVAFQINSEPYEWTGVPREAERILYETLAAKKKESTPKMCLPTWDVKDDQIVSDAGASASGGVCFDGFSAVAWWTTRMMRLSSHVQELSFADFTTQLPEIQDTSEHVLRASLSFKPLKEATEAVIQGILALEVAHPLRRELLDKKDEVLRSLSFLNIHRNPSTSFFSRKTTFDDVVVLFNAATPKPEQAAVRAPVV
ncbi:MAG: HEAT repeat domain-containing protein [Legionellales bacterium]|nr:HEAT repeat domain-containing protein [Legionellales bacterium]